MFLLVPTSAEALGYSNVVRAFLDPTLRNVDLLHGVSFASAGSGYDDLTVNFSVSVFLFLYILPSYFYQDLILYLVFLIVTINIFGLRVNIIFT